MPPSLWPASQGGSTASSPAGSGLTPHLAWSQGEQGLRRGILGAVGMTRPSALHAHGVPAQAEGASSSRPGGGAVGVVTLRQEQRPRLPAPDAHFGTCRFRRLVTSPSSSELRAFAPLVWSGLVWLSPAGSPCDPSILSPTAVFSSLHSRQGEAGGQTPCSGMGAVAPLPARGVSGVSTAASCPRP